MKYLLSFTAALLLAAVLQAGNANLTLYTNGCADSTIIHSFDGQQLRLTAQSVDGHFFKQWSDGNTDNPRLVTVAGDAAYKAEFTPYCKIQVLTDGCETPNVIHSFDGQQLRLTAQSADGHFFKQWSDGNTDNPRLVTVAGDATYKAEFTPYCKIQVLTDGCETPNVISSFFGQQLRLTAQSLEGRSFKMWSDGNTDNPRLVTVAGDATYKAEFTPYCKIQVLTDGCETPNVISSFFGQQLRLTAQSLEGRSFKMWSDGNTDNPRQVVVTCDSNFTALFDIKQCSWQVKSNDLEMGTVYTNFTNKYYTYGTQITVNASPNSGYKFVKWNDGKKYNPYTFSLLDDKYLIAIFIAEEEEQDTTTVQPQDTTATFHWPLIDGGYAYTLTIYADATCTEVICTLTFNQYGQLIGITFGAPKRGGLSSQEESFSCTVSGLEAGQEYFYRMETTDIDGKLINTDEGGFSTSKSTPTYMDNIYNPINSQVTKIFKEGQLYILRDGKTYNAQGREVE